MLVTLHTVCSQRLVAATRAGVRDRAEPQHLKSPSRTVLSDDFDDF